MTTSTNHKLFSYLKISVKFFIAFAIIFYLILSGKLDLDAVKKGFSNTGVMAFSFVCLITAAMMGMYRWNLLLRGQNICIDFWNTVRYSFIGIFFNTTMPGIVSGDIIKAWYVISDQPKGQSKTPIVTTILLDRIMGLFGLIIVSSSALVLNWLSIWSDRQMRWIAGFSLILLAAVIFFFLYVALSNWGPLAWIRDKLDNFKESKPMGFFLKVYDAWMIYRARPKILIVSLGLSVCMHILVVLTVIFCSKALGETALSIYEYFLLVPIGLLTTALPIAPAGLGVGHYAFSELFKRGGSEMGATVFTLYVAVQICINLFGVFFYLKSPKIAEQQLEQSL